MKGAGSAWFALARLALAAAAMTGCSSPCDDLQTICNQCIDPNQKASCEREVAKNTHDACSQGIDNFTNVCP